MSGRQAQVMVMNTTKQQEGGKKAQLSNIVAGKTVADIVRTCLGPRAMLKMLLDPMGGITMTNDGFAILRECEAAHPAAKSIIELSRTQDEEVGDGTTSVIVLAGEMLAVAQPLLDKQLHPVEILQGYRAAQVAAERYLEELARPVDETDDAEMISLIATGLGTKIGSRWQTQLCQMALTAVRIVGSGTEDDGRLDVKRYARIEKIPGGEIESSEVIRGIMVNKDVVHAQMRRHIENPRIVLLDCPLEYRKGESQTNIELTRESDWERILKLEEEQIERMCTEIARVKPDVVVTEKGVSDLAQHYLARAGVSVLRRMRRLDVLRLGRACGAQIVTTPSELHESDVGVGCGLFDVRKIGDEYFSFFERCTNPAACSLLLRGPSKDTVNEIERNLHDAISVARNVLRCPKLVPGAGASEMAIATRLARDARSQMAAVAQWPCQAVADALEVIPRTLVQNAGGNVIKTLAALRAKHELGEHTWGVDGTTGKLADVNELGIWEPLIVKQQTIRTAIEAATMLLRVDDIVPATSKKSQLNTVDDD